MARKATNRECKKKLLHYINKFDLKEEKMDLSKIEYETRGILK